MSVLINIAGDFCISPAYLQKSQVSDEVKALYAEADINIVNLECPINKWGDSNKIIKHGPHLHTTEAITAYLQQLNITAVTLANNHILDYGEEALLYTIACCQEQQIKTTGAGKNVQDAAQFLLIEKNNCSIAIVNFCENEWSVATEETAGANPLEIIENITQIKKAKQLADKVLVIFHGGNEFYHLPSPRIKKLFRFLADTGADAIICHHAHCISGYEVYNGTPILYGLGNMLFTKHSDEPGWCTGLTAQLEIKKNAPITFRLIPTVQDKNNFYHLSLPPNQTREEILNEVESLSSIISNDEKLTKEWIMLVEKRTAQYLYSFSAIPALPGRYVKSALRRLGFVNKLLPKKYLTGIINYLSCEAHRDIATQVLKNKLYKK